MQFRQLLPSPDTVELAQLLAELELGQDAAAQRPYTVANFVASADGRAAFQGRSGALGDDGDQALFKGLRTTVDAVMVGTGTLRAERYGRMISDPDTRRRRTERGLAPEPIACIVTRSGAVPTDTPLFQQREARIVVFSPGELDDREASAAVELVRLDPGELTLTTVLRHLRSQLGIGSLLCEGGPTLLGALILERLLDELFLTIAPKLVGGGTSPTISSGPELPEPQPLALRSLLERHGSLFLRYSLR